MVEDNKQAARVVFEVWSSGQLERLDALVAPHVVHHDPYDVHAAEGLAGMKQTIESTRQAFPDIELKVEDQIAEGDKVVTRWRAQMTHTGERAGLTPTTKEITITGITIDRFENGLIVEAWRSMGQVGLASRNRRRRTRVIVAKPAAAARSGSAPPDETPYTCADPPAPVDQRIEILELALDGVRPYDDCRAGFPEPGHDHRPWTSC